LGGKDNVLGQKTGEKKPGREKEKGYTREKEDKKFETARKALQLAGEGQTARKVDGIGKKIAARKKRGVKERKSRGNGEFR